MAENFGIYDTSTGLWLSCLQGWQFGGRPQEWNKIAKASNIIGHAPAMYRGKLQARIISAEAISKALERQSSAQQETVCEQEVQVSDREMAKLKRVLDMSPSALLVLIEYADILSRHLDEINADYILRLKKADGIQQDYLHLIENEDLTDKEKVKLFDDIKASRHGRREVKNVLSAIDVMRDGDNVSKKVDSLKEWKYTPRQSPDMFPTESERYNIS